MTNQVSTEGNLAAVQTPHLDWKAALRQMHMDCAVQWMVSADFWRKEAAKYLVAENYVMASEALFNAQVREDYAAQDLAKAGVESGKLRVDGGVGSAPGAAVNGANQQVCPTGGLSTN